MDQSAAMKFSKVGVIVPALNAGSLWPQFSHALLLQGLEPDQVLIVDSQSADDTASRARACGFRVVSIERRDFNHGGTRQWATQFFPDAEIFIYLTQDAILAEPEAVGKLIAVFDDPDVGAAYGRQLPKPGAGPIEAHGRLFNYPSAPDLRSFEDRARLGFKTIFISNSFAAYRRTALEDAGGFPLDTIFGEDTVTAARMLLKGWKVAYVADARVHHSHEHSVSQEFRRYFDIGVLHSREPWMKREFGGANGEGRRYAISELRHLWNGHPLLIPSALMRTAAKLGGYWMGQREAKLSNGLRHRMSMHPGFWR
jgi:rhamnosyltransferase